MIRMWMIVLIVIAALVLLILFYPLFYRLDADLDERRGSLRAYWLFRLFRFRFLFDEEMELVLAILFFNIDFLDEEKRARRKERRKKDYKEKDGKEEDADGEKSTLKRVTSAVKTSARVLYLLREYSVLSEAVPPIRIFLFRTRPRDVHGCVGFGMSDPSETGQIAGVLSTLPFMYQTDLVVNPDFETEETYFKGDIHVKGHTMIIFVLILAVRLMRNNNIRAFIDALRSKE